VVNTKICYFDVTMNCSNSDAINAYVFVDIVLFTKENTTFSDILLQDKCDRIVIKRISFEAMVVFITCLTATTTKAI